MGRRRRRRAAGLRDRLAPLEGRALSPPRAHGVARRGHAAPRRRGAWRARPPAWAHPPRPRRLSPEPTVPRARRGELEPHLGWPAAPPGLHLRGCPCGCHQGRRPGGASVGRPIRGICHGTGIRFRHSCAIETRLSSSPIVARSGLCYHRSRPHPAPPGRGRIDAPRLDLPPRAAERGRPGPHSRGA